MKASTIVFAGLFCILSSAFVSASATDAKPKTVAALYEGKAKLAGQTISAHGKVVKVNNGIMDRNWIHIQDGTGNGKTSDLVVTSKQTAEIGNEVAITGVVAVNRDFGSGYAYPLLIEDASIEVKK